MPTIFASVICASLTFAVRSPLGATGKRACTMVPVSFVAATSLLFASVTLRAPMVGPGYVPERSPEAAPLGGSAVGAPVILPHATSVTLASVTAPAASSGVPTASALISGWGYVPARSPPAGPVGGAPLPLVHASVGPVATVSTLPPLPTPHPGHRLATC